MKKLNSLKFYRSRIAIGLFIAIVAFVYISRTETNVFKHISNLLTKNTSAILSHPQGIARDSNGNIYIADTGNSRVLKVDKGGQISTFAGKDGATITVADFTPTSVAVNSSGDTVFVADSKNGDVWKMCTSGAKKYVVQETPSKVMDNKVVAAAHLNNPQGIASDLNGNFFYVAVTDINCVMKINASNGNDCSIIAGTDGNTVKNVSLNKPTGITVDLNGNIYIADTGNNCIRKISSSNSFVETFASDLNTPQAIAVSSDGKYVYIVDTKIQGVLSYKADDHTSTVSKPPSGYVFKEPYQMVVDSDGNKYIADAGNNTTIKTTKDSQIVYINDSTKNSPKLSSSSTNSSTASIYTSDSSLSPLKLYWSPGRGDNFTTSTSRGEADAIVAGYSYSRIEARIFQDQVTGTVPLKLYWSNARGDNFTTSTAKGEVDAIAAGYTFVRIEGYVYPTQVAGTVPLKLYWNSGRGDNFVTATARGEADAIAAGYTFVRIEGYVYPEQQKVMTPLKLYWSGERGDNFTTSTAKGETDAKAANYSYAHDESYVFPTQVSGTVPLKLYWSSARGDNFVTATAKGEADAKAAGYAYVRNEGYVYSTQVPGTVPLKLYWNSARGDNFTTSTPRGEVDAIASGYTFVRIEGYVYPYLNGQNDPISKQYDLVIITPEKLSTALKPLVDFKNSTGVTTKCVTLENIYKAYPGRDEAEKVKRYLADQKQNCGIQYAMLIGNTSIFPIRFTKTDRGTPAAKDTAFYPTDLYYADLFNSNGSFSTWDTNNNGYYGELKGETTTGIMNLDKVDKHPDIAVGRVPVILSLSQVTTYVNKVIQYEKTAHSSSWANSALMIATTDWSVDASKTSEYIANNYFKNSTVYKLYGQGNPSLGTPLPIADNISKYLNNGVGFVSYIGHGNKYSWHGCFNTTNLSGLTNISNFSIMFASACDTSGITIQPPYENYTDINHNKITGTQSGNVFTSIPPQPSCFQTSYSTFGSESILLETGAVGYVGCVTGSQQYSMDLNKYFFESQSRETLTLGEMWNYSIQKYYKNHVSPFLILSPDWTKLVELNQPWKFILFGDPSLRVGGIPDDVKEDVVYFDYTKAEIKKISNSWKIVIGDRWLYDFGTDQERAVNTLNTIRYYKATTRGFIGRPSVSMEYFLTNGSAPQGFYAADTSINFNPASIRIEQISSRWKIVEGENVEKYIFDFDTDFNKAKLAYNIIQKYGFNNVCFIKGTNTTSMYFRR